MKPTRTPHSIAVQTLVAAAIYTVAAACVADQAKGGGAYAPPGGIDPSAILPLDRATTWNPGMMGVGGIPVRFTVCATLTACGGEQDDTAQIPAATERCPANRGVQLEAGTIFINSGKFLLLNKSVTLRGAGPGRTTLVKTNGAKRFRVTVSANPLIVVGPSRFADDPGGVVGCTNLTAENLTADGAKGAYTVTVASTAGFSPGQIVLLDEASGAGWKTDPLGRGQIWTSPARRVVWRKHDPVIPYVDGFAADKFPTMPGTAGSWFSRQNRPTAEIKKIAPARRCSFPANRTHSAWHEGFKTASLQG